MDPTDTSDLADFTPLDANGDLTLPDASSSDGSGDTFDLSSALASAGGVQGIAGQAAGIYRSTDLTIGGPNGLAYTSPSGGPQPVLPKGGLSKQGMVALGFPPGTTARAVLAIIKRVGFAAASQLLRIAPAALAAVFMKTAAKPRRRRGISGRQLATAGKVLRKLGSMNRQVHKYVTAGGFGARHHSARPPPHKARK